MSCQGSVWVGSARSAKFLQRHRSNVELQGISCGVYVALCSPLGSPCRASARNIPEGFRILIKRVISQDVPQRCVFHGANGDWGCGGIDSELISATGSCVYKYRR